MVSNMPPHYQIVFDDVKRWIRSCLTSEQVSTLKNGIRKLKPESISDFYARASGTHLVLVLSKMELQFTKIFDFDLMIEKIVHHLSMGFKMSDSNLKAELEDFAAGHTISASLLCLSDCAFCERMTFVSERQGIEITREVKHLMNYYKVHADMRMLQRSLLSNDLLDAINDFFSPLEPELKRSESALSASTNSSTSLKRANDEMEQDEVDEQPPTKEQKIEQTTSLWRPFNDEEQPSYNPRSPDYIPDTANGNESPDYTPQFNTAAKRVPEIPARMKFDSSKFPVGEPSLF